MNNIYVDELPKSCVDCPCEYEYYCNVCNCELYSTELYEKIPADCPLKPLSDRLAEERKKVIWEIRKRAKRTQFYIKITEKSPTAKEKCFVYEVSDDLLDQIERGE